MTRIVFLLLLAGAAPSMVAADSLTAEKRADIERLLDMTGAMAVGQQMAGAVSAQVAQTIKQVRPDIPQKLIDALPQEIEAVFSANTESLKAAVIPIYDKHFTAAEVKETIRFYSTDLGKKLIKVMPALAQESMSAGQKWGEALAPQINDRVRARFKKEGIQI